MYPYIDNNGNLACGCGSTNLKLGASELFKLRGLPQFSIICMDCSRRRKKYQHVCGFGSLEEIIKRDCKDDGELIEKTWNNIIINQLRMPYDPENRKFILSELKDFVEF